MSQDQRRLLREKLAALAASRRYRPSLAQERLLFVEQVSPGTAAYNVPLVFVIRGYLSISALERAVNHVIARHESLRTSFHVGEDGQFAAEVSADARISVIINDLTAIEEDDKEQFAVSQAESDARVAFDLSTAPLCNVSLYVLSEERYVLLINCHHLVVDGWSVGVFLEELTKFYRQETEGSPAGVRPLAWQYRQFAEWQRRWVEGEHCAGLIQEWKEALSGAKDVMELPSDHIRFPISSYQGRRQIVTISRSLATRVEKLARDKNMTPFIIYLASFLALVYRYAGQEDVIIGYPVANRRREELESMIGMFSSTLVLRAKVDERTTASDLLVRVREAMLWAYDHQDVPIERLIDELGLARDMSRNPLFQVSFSYLPGSTSLLTIDGADVLSVDIDNRTSKFDMSITVERRAEDTVGVFVYSTELFDDNTISRFINYYLRVLEAVTGDLGCKVDEIDIMTAEDRAQLYSWSRSSLPDVRPTSLAQMLADKIGSWSDEPAIITDDQVISYREFHSRACKLARELRRRGVGRGFIVGIVMDRSPEQIIAIHAVVLAGGAYLPLEPDYPLARLEAMVEDARPCMLIVDEHWLHDLQTWADTVVTVPVLETEAAQFEPELLPDMAEQDDLLYVMYTSGSTGRPKGVMVPHRGPASRMVWTQNVFNYGPGYRVLYKTAVGFDVSVTELFWPFLVGATVVVARPGGQAEPAYLIDLIERYHVSFAQFVPSMLRVFLDAPGLDSCKSLRQVISIGEALPPDVIARFRELPTATFYNVYGPTEASIEATWWECPREWSGAHVPIGRPVNNTRVWIVDDNMRLVPPGVDGELCIGGACLAFGYMGNQELTREQFVADPFSKEPGARLYRTGDRCRFSADGTIVFRGRIDDQVQIRGLRTELGEIEGVLQTHPDVAMAAVRFFDDQSGLLVAYVEPAQESAPAPAALAEYMKQFLPENMVPSAFITVPCVPLTAAGKVDRQALPRPEADMIFVSSSFVEPVNDLERSLVRIWQQLLGRDSVGTGDDFFELGGHSLLAIRVIARVRQELGVDLALRDLLTTRTISGLAKIIGDLPTSEAVDLRQAPDGGVSSFQEQLWLLDRLDPGQIAYNLPEVMLIGGDLDPDCLETALVRIWDRHVALRSTFVEQNGRPQLEILSGGSLRLARTDLRQLDQPYEEALARVEQFICQPFDLASGPLFRGQLYRTREQQWVLALCCHHIIVDGQSLSLLLAELETAYNDIVCGGPDRLPPVPWQYHQFARFQKEQLMLSATQGKIQQAVERLSGAPEQLGFPLDHAGMRSGNGATREIVLSQEVLQQLSGQLRSEGVTQFMALLTVFFALLYRYTGEEDLVVGTPFSLRDVAGAESVIGYFVNPLPVRVTVNDNMSFRELAVRVKHAVEQAFDTASVPFDRLVDELDLRREAGRNPLFEVMFAVADRPGLRRLGGAEVSRIEMHTRTSKFMLNMAIILDRQGCRSGLEFDTDLFGEQTIDDLLRHYRNLLEAAALDPSLPIADAAMMNDQETEGLVMLGTGPVVALTDESLCELIDHWCTKTADAVAVVAEREMTYRDLQDETNRLAAYLLSLGVGPGTIVGLGIPRSVQMIAGIVAVQKCGAAYLPLDPGYPADRLQFMIADADLKVILTTELAANAFTDSGITVVCVDRDQDRIQEFSTESPGIHVDPSSTAYVIYTSGTTGRPKGALCHHRGIVNLVGEVQRLCPLSPGARHSLWTSLNFDASVYEIYTALVTGGCLYIVPEEIRADGPAVIDWLEQNEIDSGYMPPFLVPDLVQRASPKLKLKRLMVGVEPLSERELAQISQNVPDLQILNAYGPTEASVISSFYPIRDYYGPDRPAPIGRPIQNGLLLVLDRLGRLTPRVVPGELFIGGVGVAAGYLQRPQLTAERFVPDPLGRSESRWYRSGDLVRWLPDGNLQFIGRTDRQIKLRGFRIEPGEIEVQLAAYPAVRDAVVVLSKTRPPRLIAYVVSDTELDPEDLRSFLRQRVPDHMVPAVMIGMNSLPVTPNGKIDYRALPEPMDRNEASELPEGKAGQLAAVFCAVLKLDRVGVNDNFFELGGDSLATLRIVHLAREQGIVLQPRQLFEHQTIAELVRALEVPGSDRSEDG